MALEASVVVGTFGDDHWSRLAQRAIASVPAGVPVHHVHADTLADARNGGLARVQTEWVIHLDADDELTDGYLDQMGTGTGDIRAPAVSYIRQGVSNTFQRDPWVPQVAGHTHACSAQCLPQGNYIAIGACARTKLLRDVGGWEPWPVYEDWALWLRCWLAGASVETIPTAVYRAYARHNSRNRGPAMVDKNKVHWQIVEAILPAAA